MKGRPQQDDNSTSNAAAKERRPSRLRSVLLALGLLSVGACVYAFTREQLTPENILALVAYLRNAGVATQVGCAGVAMLLMPVLFPGFVIQLFCGAVWGLERGLVISFSGTCSGQLLTFLLGRYLLKESLAVWLVRRFPAWPTVEKALFIQGGAKMITLLRLAPVMPDSVTSYGLSLTRVSTTTFTICTALAGLPYALLYCYLGSTSSNIAQTIAGGGGSRDDSSADDAGVTVLLAATSCVVVALMAVYVGVTLRRALADAAAAQQQEARALLDEEQGAEHAPLLLPESSIVKPL